MLERAGDDAVVVAIGAGNSPAERLVHLLDYCRALDVVAPDWPGLEASLLVGDEQEPRPDDAQSAVQLVLRARPKVRVQAPM